MLGRRCQPDFLFEQKAVFAWVGRFSDRAYLLCDRFLYPGRLDHAFVDCVAVDSSGQRVCVPAFEAIHGEYVGTGAGLYRSHFAHAAWGSWSGRKPIVAFSL